MEERSQKKGISPKLSRIIYTVVLVLLIGVFLFSAGSLAIYYWESNQSQQTYNHLQDLKGDYTRPPAKTEPVTPGTDETAAPTEPHNPYVTVTDPETGEDVQLLPQFAELYQLNNDLVGWITVPGTNIDYPVVQRKETIDYYLRRDYHGKYDSHGCIYVREVCDVNKPSDNVTLYGHRMKDHTMFGQLAKYEKKEYWEQNQYLYFDTLTEFHTYQIISVFTTTASVGEGFQYHLFVDALEPSDMKKFLSNCKANALYQTGLTAEYGDKLLTLSTCEYTHENGRLVIVAKRIQ